MATGTGGKKRLFISWRTGSKESRREEPMKTLPLWAVPLLQLYPL
jgi:hypothetical protein